MRLVSVEAMRHIDRTAIAEAGISGFSLMENAGRAVVAELLSVPVLRRVVVLAGPGNNGGDGHVIARLLHERGVAVTELLAADPARIAGDAQRSNQRSATSRARDDQGIYR